MMCSTKDSSWSRMTPKSRTEVEKTKVGNSKDKAARGRGGSRGGPQGPGPPYKNIKKIKMLNLIKIELSRFEDSILQHLTCCKFACEYIDILRNITRIFKGDKQERT